MMLPFSMGAKNVANWKFFFYIFFISHFSTFVKCHILTPPYFNLAEGRRIVATATCGEDVPEPELFCKLVGANADNKALGSDDNIVIQGGQFCDHCDPRKPDKSHPPDKAVDGRETWWQSPPLSRGIKYNEVNLTIDLGQEFHVAYVIVKMGNSPRPDVWILERSSDNGQTYFPWQYFASSPSDCQHYFGPNVSSKIVTDDTVICDTKYNYIVPLEGGEIVVPLVQNRPSANDFFNSTVLQEWTRATNVRFRLLKVKNLLGHLMSVGRQDPTITRRYYYSIKDISIGGRCRCNAHADTCTSIDQNDPYKLVCDCKDNTCGPNCDVCCPGFEQKKWSQSKNNKRFVCEKCNCFGHSNQCAYNETIDYLKLSLDIHGNLDGGGVCQNCQDNTEGINCNKCIHGYYRPNGKMLNDTDVCQRCQCDNFYSTGNCADGFGQCECKPEYTKPNCDSCSFGHYGFPLCRLCECYVNGTTSLQCEPDNGQCFCQNNFGGPYCRKCAEGFYNFPECKTCDCNSLGSVSNVCDHDSGACKCKNSFGGRTCDQCSDGYYSFPVCSYCNCDVKGTVPEVCNKTTGQCICKPGYGGPRCDQCVANFTGFPDCKPCNCSSVGSAFSVCDITGKCTCLPNYAGKLCDQCYPGFYQYPNCLACNCHLEGTIGVTCSNDGTCKCKLNFDDEKCNQCKEGFYNFPICEECNFDPAGVIASFTGCSSLEPGQMLQFQCKPHVQGKICGECRELYWNLQPNNPEGCEDCGCNRSGTIGRIGICDSKTGQCVCKPSTRSRKCDQCVNGYYDLTDSSLFGCIDCECDIGSSLNNICDKKTGKCVCLPRISGRNCRQPLGLHYFPTLHQHQYEVEDGHTPSAGQIRYGFDERVFPNYSWRGYGIFSPLQNETVHEVMIDKPSVYRMILLYINLNQQSVSGTISATPEDTNNIDTEQKFQVLFKPSQTPSFVTVAGISSNIPSPFVLNPGPWSIKIKIEKSLFLDYFVLIPAEYYEASLLVSKVSTPCTVDKIELCRHYQYPNVSWYDQIKGLGAYLNDGDNRAPVKYYFDDLKESLGVQKMPVLSEFQSELYLDIRISQPGMYVLVINYATTKNQNTTTVQLAARSQNTGNKGTATIYNCRYTMLCRQVALDREGKVAIFDFDSNFISLILKGVGDGIAVDSVVAIPLEKWSLDYVQPKPACIMNDNKCVPSTYLTPPDSERYDFKSGNEIRVNRTLPNMIFNNGTELIYLDYKDAMVDVSGKVPKPGPYVFVVHYYQPDFPEFDMDVLIQNGQFYEAKLPVQHCPSITGCRSEIKQGNGNNIFQLTENFVLTLKEPNHKSIWLHYLLVIPSTQYTGDVIFEQPFDQTAIFISQCGHNHFHLNTSEEGFCKDATFSLTTKYNHGALPCYCDFDGSLSFECAKFGGQCPCRENVIGRRCDSCKTGYFGFPYCKPCGCINTATCDPITGECICPQNVYGEECDQCKPYTYGFDILRGCEDCNCNLFGVKNNNVQCNVNDGSCECKEYVEGRTCDRCVAGNFLFPNCSPCECDLRGTTEEICDQTTAGCLCKSNVHGMACDVCKDGTFNIQSDNAEGCTKCFCFGKTSRCSSSNLFISVISTLQNWKLVNVNITKNVEVADLPTNIDERSNSISVNMDFILGGITYFVAPEQYLNNKLTAYGGYLNYTVHYTADKNGNAVAAPDVILHGANMYLLYTSVEQPAAVTYFRFSVRIIEQNFVTPTGSVATREELMQVLQNLTALYIRATFSEKNEITQLLSMMFEVAGPEYSPSTDFALSVEQCHCPPNYVGLSCEECADGYYRVSTGPFGGYCIPCQCNGHASACDKTTGICYNCKHYTEGDHCEKCEMGYYGNATVGAPTDCLICACPLPIQSNNFATGCEINESGDRIICDCLPGYAGERCEKCGPGHFGRPEITGQICVPCECNGNTDPSDPYACDHITGQCTKCLSSTYGNTCERCAPGYFGNAIDAKNCQSCDCDKCGTRECDHKTGQCLCHENVVGDKCDRCAIQHFGFTTCQGCIPCNCDLASDSLQCDDLTGHCKCRDGVIGRTCDRCAAGYWQYSALGCTSCGCNTGYSVGVGCNSTTGVCQCLPRVSGDKCNYCPYRNVLIPNDGCFECNKCTHGLLDVTDEIRSEFLPIFKKFQTSAIGYFTTQRLLFINNTVHKLAANVSDVLSYQFDLTPFINRVSNVEKEAEASRRTIASIYNDALSAAKNGDLAYADALEVEALINKEIEKSKMTVYEINNLVYSLEAGAVGRTDYAVRDGEKVLQTIENFALDQEKIDETNEVIGNAADQVISVSKFTAPLNKTVNSLENVKNKVESFDNKLDELQNYTNSAQKMANEVADFNQLHKNTKLKERIHSVDNLVVNANEILQEAKVLLHNASSHLDIAALNFANLAENNTRLKESTMKADENITALKSELNSAVESVVKAGQHAEELEMQANILKSSIKEHNSKHAVQAANAYKDIDTAIKEASNATNEAMKAAEIALVKSEGIYENTQSSWNKSTDLLETARKALKDVQQDLAPQLSMTLQKQNSVSKNVNETSENVDNIYKQLEEQSKQRTIDSKLRNLKPDDVSANAQNTLNSIKKISENSPEKLQRAKKLYANRDTERKSIQQATNFLDGVEKDIPKITDAIAKFKNKPQEFNNTADDITELLEKLKQKISVTKDLASRIKVGVELHPNTSLELPVPNSMAEQGSSSDISMYFKTDQPNGLLFYVGNEMSLRQKRETVMQKIRRPKADDFVALEIENGYALLTADLGEKIMTSMVIKDKFIADNKWYSVRFQRTGKSSNLTIREELNTSPKTIKSYSKSGQFPGFHFLLNLDKDSKFFIGGIPSSFDAPSVIKYPTFNGQVEELTIDGEPIGLWNFEDVSTYPSDTPASKAIKGSKERDVLLTTISSSGCRLSGEGYVVLKALGYQLQNQTDVRLRFKTSSSDGLLFLVSGAETFLSIELGDGFIFFKYNVGKGVVYLKSSSQYNDDKWHSIEASRFYNEGMLNVDGEKTGSTSAERDVLLKMSEHIYIGGYPGDHKINDVTKISFDGCIDEVQIGGTSVDLNNNLNAHGIVPGCSEKYSKYVSFEEGSHGYLRWSGTNVQAIWSTTYGVEISFRFKTKAKNGLIAFGSDASSYFHVLLSEGEIIFKSGAQEVNSSGSSTKFNDDRWHAILAVHDPNALHLVIDDISMFKSPGTPNDIRFLPSGTIFFGTVPSNIDAAAAFETPFSGCIGDATINGVVINFDESEGIDTAVGRCSGPVQRKISFKASPDTTVARPFTFGPSIDTTAIAPILFITTKSPVTVATGCLPLYPASDPDLTKDSGLRFGTVHNSALTYDFDQLQYKGKVKFSIEIKTISQEGIIFYVTQPQKNDFMALYLKDSKIYFTFACASTSVSLSSEIVVNEGEWHTIQFKVDQNLAELITDKDNQNSENGCKPINIASPYYVGGMDSLTLTGAEIHLKGLNTTFVGCVKNFKVNGIVINPTKSVGVIPCSSKVESGTFFSVNGGYLKAYERFKVGKTINIKMEIKPRNLSGLLMAVHSKKDYLILQMIDGSIKFTVENGNGPVFALYKPSSPVYFCDGRWHTIHAYKNKNVVTLNVDDESVPPSFDTAGNNWITDTNHPLYIGGYPSTLPKPRGIDTNAHYVGCIKNVEINQRQEQLSSFTANDDVMWTICPTI